MAVSGPASGSIISSNTPTVTGTAHPDSVVTITEGGKTIGTGTADKDGNWSIVVSELTDGAHTITVTDNHGQSKNTNFTIDPKFVEIAPVVFPAATVDSKRPVLTGTGQPGAAIVITDADGTTVGTGTVGEDGKWSITPTVDLSKGGNSLTATQTPQGGGAPSEATATVTVNVIDPLLVTGPTPGQTVDTDTPTVSGTGEPGSKITVTGPDGKLGETVVDENGDWSLTLPKLPEGENTITVTDDKGGKVDVGFTVTPEAGTDPEAGASAGADPNTGADGADTGAQGANTGSDSSDRANANAAASAAATAKADDNSNASAQAAAQAAAFSDATSQASAAADVSAEAAAKAAATPTASSNTTANLTSASNSAAEASAAAAANADNSSNVNGGASQRATTNAQAASKSAATPNASADASGEAGANGPAKPKWKRLGGANRYETAVKVSKDSYPRGAKSVIIARSDIAPDALSAAPFAAKVNAPVLLTPPTTLVKETKAEIKRLKPSTVYIAGGTGAISAAVEAEIRGMGVKIVRMAGSDRYATSLKIAETGWKNGSEKAFVATGRDYPDALSAGSAAGATGVPVILVDGKQTGLTGTAKTALGKYGTKHLYIAGGHGAVSTGVESAMRGGGKTVERFAGGTRYETSAAIAKQWHTKGGLVYLATGVDFPDALAGSAVAGAQSAPIMLTTKNCVPKPVKDAITGTIKPQAGYVLGGTGVITDRVLNSQPAC